MTDLVLGVVGVVLGLASLLGGWCWWSFRGLEARVSRMEGVLGQASPTFVRRLEEQGTRVVVNREVRSWDLDEEPLE